MAKRVDIEHGIFSKEAVMNQRRRTPRIAFVAAAELCDKKWGRQLTAQVRELSAYGCYVGTLHTLPVANSVLLKIFARSECFEAMAKVIYTHRNRGMGLIFQELSLQSGNLLRQWLLKSFQGVSNF